MFINLPLNCLSNSLKAELCLIPSYPLRVYNAEYLLGRQHDWIEGLWHHDWSRKMPTWFHILSWKIPQTEEPTVREQATVNGVTKSWTSAWENYEKVRWCSGCMKKPSQFTQSQQLSHITLFITFYFIL